MESIAHQNQLTEILKIIHDNHNLTDLQIEDFQNLLYEINYNSLNDSESILSKLIINTLLKKFNSNINIDNLYEIKSTTPQIVLFNILIDKFPFVKYSQAMINQAIINQMESNECITLIDIGIGQGTQIINILSQLGTNSFLKKIKLIGIEPFENALQICQTNIEEFANNSKIEIHFYPICEYIEKFNFDKIKSLIEGDLVINASLALHHIQTYKDRLTTLQQLKQLNPKAFYLIEPNVDHMVSELKIRISNCYNHFLAIFKTIDNLDILKEDKNSLKLFFGREIEDILGKNESERYERHDTALHWLEILENAGFSNQSNQLKLSLTESYGVYMKYHEDGFFGFTYDSETVLAVLYVA